MKRRRRSMSRRERGVALIATLIALVVIATAAADFAYNTQVDLVSATNARDDLRAHYLARSGINLARLLFRVQERMIEPNRQMLAGMDLQIADYAPLLVTAFNSKEGAEALGSVLGVQSEGIKGLGVDTGSFDLELESLDGRINLNCAGGTNTGSPEVTRIASELAALMLPPRYDRLFEEPDLHGEYADRLEVMRAIVDWADQDTVMYGSSAAEDYRYNTGKDPYEIKNHYFDTIEELRLVKGVDDDFMAAFGDAFTVYGDCKVNISLASAPVLASLILQFASTPNDPALQWENLMLLARYLVHIRDLMGGFTNQEAFVKAVEDPTSASALLLAMGGENDAQQSLGANLSSLRGVKLNASGLSDAIGVGGARRIWRIKASATVGRVQKMIQAVWDTKGISLQMQRNNSGPGTFLYWREE